MSRDEEYYDYRCLLYDGRRFSVTLGKTLYFSVIYKACLGCSCLEESQNIRSRNNNVIVKQGGKLSAYTFGSK